uniref:Glycosyl transferase family 11 n=1 Tax=viral metagenome TaxID=1070528 RepID=A0A6C0K016_9ZZZZ
MQVCDFPQGRFGNSIFRYLASSLFCILYDATRTYDESNSDIVFSDANFIEWSNSILNNEIPIVDASKKYLFRGYYQHDSIFLKYRHQLITHINAYPQDLLITDGYKPGVAGIYHYTVTQYHSIDLLQCPNHIPTYDIVVHLRLEDFVFVNQLLHPQCISAVLDNFSDKTICFVMNAPTTAFEHRYINYFKTRYNIVCESNDTVTDYHIIKNAKTLLCSRSTMCWAAAFFSDTLETVYFPNYTNPNHPHETFKKPIENTIPYYVQFASEHDVNMFFDNIV